MNELFNCKYQWMKCVASLDANICFEWIFCLACLWLYLYGKCYCFYRALNSHGIANFDSKWNVSEILLISKKEVGIIDIVFSRNTFGNLLREWMKGKHSKGNNQMETMTTVHGTRAESTSVRSRLRSVKHLKKGYEWSPHYIIINDIDDMLSEPFPCCTSKAYMLHHLSVLSLAKHWSQWTWTWTWISNSVLSTVFFCRRALQKR